ncbi:hypothetical protein [Plantactinospora sp. B5E13]|uniref:hypothetical protein n=1 Tax=Plantactinospora sp. B5E13 TaxID=3153758 RepID=UPI00325D9FB3
MVPTNETPEALTALFRRGEIYADSWPDEVRRRLNVEDPLADLLTTALDSSRHVVLTGNAGDGKSHLAVTAMAAAKRKNTLEPESAVVPRVRAGDRVFIRDAAAVSDEAILTWTSAALSAGAQLVITLNEGPLASLAALEPDGVYARLRDVAHARARGDEASDPEGFLLINLAGRQLVHGEFIAKALDRLLPAVVACDGCRDATTCPRTVGRDLLLESSTAPARLTQLLRLLAHSGTRMTARDLWMFLVDLFFGWECPPGAGDIDRLPGWWWSRAFSEENWLGKAISREFDPVNAAEGSVDVQLWLGDAVGAEVPPAALLVAPFRQQAEDPGEALRAFIAAKRAWFFLSPYVDATALVARQSRIPEYMRLLEAACEDPLTAARRVVGLINMYRLNDKDDRRLYLSQHHVLTAVERPRVLAASQTYNSDAVRVRVPYASEDHGVNGAGFVPARLELGWPEQLGNVLVVDYPMWLQLQEQRTIHADRRQEALDAALDLFIGSAPATPDGDPQISVYDHQTGIKTRITAFSGKHPAFEVNRW